MGTAEVWLWLVGMEQSSGLTVPMSHPSLSCCPKHMALKGLPFTAPSALPSSAPTFPGCPQEQARIGLAWQRGQPRDGVGSAGGIPFCFPAAIPILLERVNKLFCSQGTAEGHSRELQASWWLW